MPTARICVLAAAVCAVFAAPDTARAAQSQGATVSASSGGCSSQSDMPSPWLGLGLICLGGVLRSKRGS
ncbi:MAG: hypothetical protein ACE37F_01880 [Nannocystaceae bacterium]|nr:hypothetical protein [bacterium]